MANIYVDSNAAGAGTGADWANAYTTLAAAYTAKAAGDDFWVAHNHAETQASNITLTCPGTAASPCRTICVTSAGTVPPVSADLRTTATISATGASSIIWASGHSYVYGITFNAGSGSNVGNITLGNTSTDAQIYLEACTLKLLGTLTASINLGSASQPATLYTSWKNTTVSFGAAGSGISVLGMALDWTSTASAVAGTVPTNLFRAGGGNARPVRVLCDGVDLSFATSTLVQQTASGGRFIFKDCKMNPTTVAATPTSPNDAATHVIRSDNSTAYYRQEKYDYLGTETVETTIVRTGGATDYGTGQAISKKIVTSANTKFYRPFITELAAANSVTGTNRTVTVYGIWGGGAVPNNDDIWIEVGYMGSASSPVRSLVSTAKADVLAAGVGVTSDSSTWGGSTTKFKLVATLSSPQPAKAGLMYVIVKCAAASSTFYIDPLVVLG